jgi:hypothetical protein
MLNKPICTIVILDYFYLAVELDDDDTGGITVAGRRAAVAVWFVNPE